MKKIALFWIVAFVLTILNFEDLYSQNLLDTMCIQLDSINFRVDSKNWEIKTLEKGALVITFKINPKGDILEFVSGVDSIFVGEQLFTYNAALRETSTVGKKLPTAKQFSDIIARQYYGEYSLFYSRNPIPLVGYYNNSTQSLIFSSMFYMIWMADGSYTNGHPHYYYILKENSSFGLSVRCIK